MDNVPEPAKKGTYKSSYTRSAAFFSAASLHALRNFLFFAHEGKVRRRQQANQASCLNLVVNAIVTWNTVYMHEVIAKLRREGMAIADADVAHLSPARYGHINPYGKYRFDIEAAPDPATLRALRDPEAT